MHPIPDDVSPAPTEDIVASARCELRLGIVDKFKQWFEQEEITGIDPNVVADEVDLAKMERRYGASPRPAPAPLDNGNPPPQASLASLHIVPRQSAAQSPSPSPHCQRLQARLRLYSFLLLADQCR
jgi:hypothetical protein